MRSKGAEAVSTLEGDPPEDGGVSNSVPSGAISQWVSNSNASTSLSDMLYVHLEETFPSSPPFLERDPNMSSTARYSPLHGAPAALPSLPAIQHTSLLPTYQHEPNQIKSISSINENIYRENNRNITVGSYALSPNIQQIETNVQQIENLHHSAISQYMNTYSEHDRLAPLLNAIDEVSTISDDIQQDSNGGFYSQQLFVTRENFNIANNENVYLPTTDMSSDSTTANQTLPSSSDIELVYSPNGEYNIIEENGMKATEDVELLINSGQSNMPYSLSKENRFIIACPTDTTNEIAKNSNNIISSIDEPMQYDNNHNVNENTDINLDIMETDLDHIKENINNDVANFKGDDSKSANNRRGRKQLSDVDISITCIPDKSVPCRAKASLPASHLSLCNTKNKDTSVIGVYARRRIPIRARFGPLEGIRKPLLSDIKHSIGNGPHFFIHTKDGDFMVDVSDENTSNWMRYVRFSPGTYQNVCLQQLDNNLYFTSCKPIPPNAELLLGYGATYARYWSLPLTQMQEPAIEWQCYECPMQFASSSELQDHLNIHDETEDQSNIKNKKKLTKESNIVNHCAICNRTFPKPYSLKRHMRTHEINAGIATRIDKALTRTNLVKDSESLITTSPEETQINFNNQNNFNIILTDHSLDAIDEKMIDIVDIKLEENNSMDSITMISKDINLENALQMYDEEIQVQNVNNKELENNKEIEEIKGESSFCCLLCNNSFSSSQLLTNHVRDEHKQSDGFYNCNLCTKRFSDYVAVKKHININHNDQIKQLSQTNINDGVTKADKEITTFSCPHCNKQFKRKDKVKEHMKKQQRVVNNNKEVIFLCAERAHGQLSDTQPDSSAYLLFMYKCHPCRLGFKRRGMLVNHLARRHPEISRATVPELQLPILRAARDYFCQHCDKVYKSSSKRKAHILKNHPGESLPPSSRDLNSSESKELEALGYSACVGAIKSAPHHCPYTPCHKQYASKAKLSQHIRHKHLLAESTENIKTDNNIQSDNFNKDKNKDQQIIEDADVLQMNTDMMEEENMFIPSPENDMLISKITNSMQSPKINSTNKNSFEIADDVSILLENSGERSDNFNDSYLNDFSNSFIDNLKTDKDKNTKMQDALDTNTLNEYVYNNPKSLPLMFLWTSGVKVMDKSDGVHMNILEKNGGSLADNSKLHISGHILSVGTNKILPLNILSKNHYVDNSYSSQYTDR